VRGEKVKPSDIDHKLFEDAEAPRCPKCRHTLSAAMGMDTDNKPRPGDATICINCGIAMIFDESLRPRFPTDAERKELAANENVQKAQAVVRQMNLNRSRSHKAKHREVH
jgi:hypothetical protein